MMKMVVSLSEWGIFKYSISAHRFIYLKIVILLVVIHWGQTFTSFAKGTIEDLDSGLEFLLCKIDTVL